MPGRPRIPLAILTIPEFFELTEHSLQTYDKLEKFRGHIYNWYDTRTLVADPPDHDLFGR